jgi:hypothetical protein
LSAYVLAGVLIAVVLVAAYVALSLRRATAPPPKLETAVTIVLSATAVASGAKVGVIAVTESDLEPFTGEDRVFIFLGSLALVWVSVAQVWKAFKPFVTPQAES